MSKVASISITDDERFIDGALDFIDHISKGLGFQADKEMKIRIVCEELLSDRIKNAYSASGFINVEISLTTDVLEVSVHDKGFPYWKSESKYDPGNIGEGAPGLEDFLIAKLADSSGSEKLGREGQRIFVRFALPVPIELTKREINERTPLDYNVTIREVKPESDEDIISAITCIYDEYRYSYGYERLYYPEHFKELITQGKYRSFIAANAYDEAAGHYGLAFSDDYPGMPEWTGVVVQHGFRGKGLFEAMLVHSIESAKSMSARAIMTQPTAYHTATQKITLRYGFTATGILFQYTNADLISEYNTNGRRLDLAIAVRFLDCDTRKAVYLPEKHTGFIDGLYHRLGASRDLLNPEPPARETILKHEINSMMKSAKVVVSAVGEYFENELAQVMRVIRKNRAEMAEMLINLSAPAAPFAYEKAKAFGYFFTGIIPCCGETPDYLVMQNLFGGEIDPGVITTIGEYTELLEYIINNQEA